MNVEVVSTTRRCGRYVSLTFDDGPDPIYTPQILDLLRSWDIRAVFCLIGQHALQFPEIVRRIAADGHVIANHTMSHPDLQQCSYAEIAQEVDDAGRAIQEVLPEVSIEYFRAPFGSWSSDVLRKVEEAEMTPLGWSVDTRDWANPGVPNLVSLILREIRDEGVVLLHDSVPPSEMPPNGSIGLRDQTVATVRRIIPELHGQGFQFDLPATR
ncbi:polysaccharide deacetylase family protein [Amycolatopsis sp. FU40]|uniref:polysaccharide deacetylase family protein n=1 Tax=Amycolatopsis sp. FU40 TaxID=2914159 RepID=UPI001F0314BC|nr:polysaccharide deacetylase family protein [Amycolatopsis sp. FU40]UKD51077.1 polysaccharide deacetylase family protein [Amycolatopsis sp. FU40]